MIGLAIGIFALIHIPIMYLTYHMWAAVQDGHARMTPRKAIAVFFIPGLNIYWLFPCIHGFAKDCNAFIERNTIHTPLLSTRVFFLYPALWMITFIPYVGIITVPMCIALIPIVTSTIVRTLNAISVHRATRE